jgi:hypothetical protein
VTVVERGKSGSYNIKPVVSESGTDVPIKEIDSDEDSLGARFVGDVDRGGSATVKVTRDGQPVSGATVTVNDESYQTGGDGTVTFDVPTGARGVVEAGSRVPFGRAAIRREGHDVTIASVAETIRSTITPKGLTPLAIRAWRASTSG